MTDVLLLSCTKEQKGVWIDMLCLMFLAPVRGVLSEADGSPWLDEVIASAIGGDTTRNLECIRLLAAKGVVSRNNRGAIFSRRMVADEHQRQADYKRVRKFRRNGKRNADETVNETPLIGTGNEINPDVGFVSSKSKANTNALKKITESYIQQVYENYPRKVARNEAFKAIAKALERLLQGESPEGLFHSLDDAVVWLMQRTKLFALSPAGQKGDYTPYPASWFNGKRYLDDESEWLKEGSNGQGNDLFSERDKARAAILRRTAAVGN